MFKRTCGILTWGAKHTREIGLSQIVSQQPNSPLFSFRVQSCSTGNSCDDKIVSRIQELLKGAVNVRRLKLVFIGPGGVGKTCLSLRLQGNDTFTPGLPATDGVAVSTMLLQDSANVRTEVCE